MMKKLVFSICVLFVGTSVFAQDFSEEDLTKYATVMKWAEDQKADLSTTVKDSVKIWLDESGVLTASLYNELSKASKSGTVEEVEASEEEVSVFTEIQGRIDEKKAVFKETYTTKIKEDIGAGLYNNLRKALKSDEELKARYDEVYNGLTEDTEDTE